MDSVAIPPIVDPSQEKPIAIARPFRSIISEHKLLFSTVFIFYVLFFGFIFRDLLYSLPDFWSGKSALATDELYPIFNWKSQFWDLIFQDISPLTNSPEFRFRYFFLTGWLRFYSFMPLSIILSGIFTAWITFLSCSFFLTRLSHNEESTVPLLTGNAVATLFIYILLWYAKIPNFYSLIVGFSFFSCSVVLFLHGLFFEERKALRYFTAASLVTLINPAVHFIVLCAIVVIVAGVFAVAFKVREKQTQRALLALLWLLVFTMIPYALFAKYFVLHGVGTLQDEVPADYYIMQQGSLPILQQLSYDTTAIMDAFLYGTYLLKNPRWLQYFYLFLALLPLLPAVRRKLLEKKRDGKIIWILAIGLGLSVWAGGGILTSGFPSFPNFISSLATIIGFLPSVVRDLGLSALYSAMSVLRYPNRFQFLMYLFSIPLIALGFAYCTHVFSSMLRWGRSVSPTMTVWLCSVCSLLFFIPLLSDPGYQITLLSGDFASFLAPYPTQDIHDIRNTFDSLPEGRMLMLPYVEGPKRVVDSNGVSHRLIDKFFIFYLNKPSLSFTNLASIYNKKNIQPMLRMITGNQNGWVNIVRDLQIRYILVNKQVSTTLPGTTDIFPNLESILTYQIAHLPQFFTKKAENEGFALYEFTDPQNKDATPTLLDLDWQTYVQKLTNDLEFTKSHKLVDSISDFPAGKDPVILTDDIEKANLDLYAIKNPSLFIKPFEAPNGLSYIPSVVPSSKFSLYPHSGNVLYSISQWNITNMIMQGIFDTLTATFSALPQSANIQFNVNAKSTQTYDIYLRAIPTKNNVKILLDGSGSTLLKIQSSHTQYLDRGTMKPTAINTQAIPSQELQILIPGTVVPVSNGFEYVKIGTYNISKGKHTVMLLKQDSDPLFVEGLLLLPVTTALQ